MYRSFSHDMVGSIFQIANLILNTTPTYILHHVMSLHTIINNIDSYIKISYHLTISDAMSLLTYKYIFPFHFVEVTTLTTPATMQATTPVTTPVYPTTPAIPTTSMPGTTTTVGTTSVCQYGEMSAEYYPVESISSNPDDQDGMTDLTEDPWESAPEDYKPSVTFKVDSGDKPIVDIDVTYTRNVKTITVTIADSEGNKVGNSIS